MGVEVELGVGVEERFEASVPGAALAQEHLVLPHVDLPVDHERVGNPPEQPVIPSRGILPQLALVIDTWKRGAAAPSPL
jgi:hypothetical protein